MRARSSWTCCESEPCETLRNSDATEAIGAPAEAVRHGRRSNERDAQVKALTAASPARVSEPRNQLARAVVVALWKQRGGVRSLAGARRQHEAAEAAAFLSRACARGLRRDPRRMFAAGRATLLRCPSPAPWRACTAVVDRARTAPFPGRLGREQSYGRPARRSRHSDIGVVSARASALEQRSLRGATLFKVRPDRRVHDSCTRPCAAHRSLMRNLRGGTAAVRASRVHPNCRCSRSHRTRARESEAKDMRAFKPNYLSSTAKAGVAAATFAYRAHRGAKPRACATAAAAAGPRRRRRSCGGSARRRARAADSAAVPAQARCPRLFLCALAVEAALRARPRPLVQGCRARRRTRASC